MAWVARGPHLCAGAALGVLCLGAASAHAQGAGGPTPTGGAAVNDVLDLSWSAPDGCPSETEVRQEARRALGKAAQGRSPLRAQAAVTRAGERYALTLVTDFEGLHGERRLDSHDCRALVQSVTLVLGVLLGAEDAATLSSAEAATAAAPLAARPDAADNAAATPPDEPTPGDPAAESATDVDASADAAQPASASELTMRTFSLRFGAGLQLGLLPTAAFIGTLGADFGFGALSVGAHAHGWYGPAQQPTRGVDTRVDGAGGSLFGCHRNALRALAIGLCGGMRAAALRGRARGPQSEPGSAVAPWYAIFVGGELVWPRDTALGMVVSGDAAVSLTRPRFVVQGYGPVHRVPPLTGQLSLGMVWSP